MFNNYDSKEKFYVIPQDEANRTSLLNIDRNTKEDIRRLHRIYIQSDWECNTIANKYVEDLLKVLYMHLTGSGDSKVLNFIPNATSVNSSVKFYDLFEVNVTQKRNESADKVGNINISFHPDTAADLIIGDNTPKEERVFEYIKPDAKFSYPDSPEMTMAMLKIDKASRHELSDKYSIMLPHEWMTVAITYTFIENIYRELIYKLVLTGKSAVSINFNDIMEFHATKKKDNVTIYIRPGMAAKLIIKSDETTEADDDDDELC